MSDEALVQEALASPDKYGELIDRYETKLHRYIKRLTSLEDETVDEILQMVFIKAYRNLAWFDTSLRFGSWIYRIAHNESIDTARKNKHTHLSLDLEDSDTGSLLDILASDHDTSAESHTYDSREALQEIFAQLSDKYREVLILHYLEGKSYEEISDILRKPQGTIATLINRAKKQFRDLASDEKYQYIFAF